MERAASEEAIGDPLSSPSYRENGMEKLRCSTWFGRVIALQGLLGLVSKMSLNMQKVNVIP